MTRIVLSREVVSAVLGRPCPTCADRAEWCGFGGGLPDDNPDCSGGVLPATSEWVVVEGRYCCLHEPEAWERYTVEYGFEMPPPNDKCVCGPPADLVEAARTGERVDLAVKCETCEGHGVLAGNPEEQPEGRWKLGPKPPLGEPCSIWVIDCTADCSDGLVVLGAALVAEVLPIYEFTSYDPLVSLDEHVIVSIGGGVVFKRHKHQDEPTSLTAQFASYDLTTIVGRWAIRLTDARRAE